MLANLYLKSLFLFQHERRVFRPLFILGVVWLFPLFLTVGLMLQGAATQSQWWVLLLLFAAYYLLCFLFLGRFAFPRSWYIARSISSDPFFVSWIDFFHRNG